MQLSKVKEDSGINFRMLHFQLEELIRTEVLTEEIWMESVLGMNFPLGWTHCRGNHGLKFQV